MEVAARNIINLHAQNPSGHTGSVNKFYNHNKKEKFKRPSDNSGQCFRCGDNHDPSTCKYINAKCYSFSARGHISPMCRDKNSQQRVSQHNQQHNQSQRMSHQPQNPRPSHQPQNQRTSHQQNSRSSQGARRDDPIMCMMFHWFSFLWKIMMTRKSIPQHMHYITLNLRMNQ